MTKKIVFFIAYFLLVTIIAAAMKKPDQTVPPVSEAILIVGAIYGVIYLIVLFVKFLKRFRKGETINVIIFITCVVVIVYFVILIVKEIGFKSYDQKKIECLKMGSDFARRRCLLIVANPTLESTPTFSVSISPTSTIKIEENKKYSSSELIGKNERYIVQVICSTYSGDIQASGVAIGRDKNDNIIVLTNYHVIENFKTYSSGVSPCVILSRPQDWSEVYYGQPTFYPDEISKKDMELIDFAFLTAKAEPRIKNENVADDGTKTEIEQTKNFLALDTFPKICSSDQLKIGEDLIVLGFPDVSGIGIPALGSTAKFTATEGIISEQISNSGYYFNTSAKIEYGSSGGGAFLKNSGCLAGLPTFVSEGKLESLGRILNVNKLRNEFLYRVIVFQEPDFFKD